MPDLYVSKLAANFIAQALNSGYYLQKTFNDNNLFRHFNEITNDLTQYELTADIKNYLLPNQKHKAYTIPTSSLKVTPLFNLNELTDQLLASQDDSKHPTLQKAGTALKLVNEELAHSQLRKNYQDFHDFVHSWLKSSLGFGLKSSLGFDLLAFYHPVKLTNEKLFIDNFGKHTAIVNCKFKQLNFNTLTETASRFKVPTSVIVDLIKYHGLTIDDFEITNLGNRYQVVLTENFINKLKQNLIEQ